MVRYKPYNLGQRRLILICFEAQIFSGNFEHSLSWLTEQELDRRPFDRKYNNDETGVWAYDPHILLKIVPRKADRTAQEAHLEIYKKLKENIGEHDRIYVMDATHPQYNPTPAYGWIKRGEEQQVPSNTVRRRLDIKGAINLQTLEPIVRLDDTINAASTIALFEQIKQANPKGQ